MACEFRATGFNLKVRIHAELCHRLKVFLGVLGGTGVETGLPASLGAGVPWLEESLRASESLCPNGSVAGRFCESKSPLPSLQSLVTAERGFVSSNWASPNGLADPLGLEQLEL